MTANTIRSYDRTTLFTDNKLQLDKASYFNMGKQRQGQERHIREKNRYVPAPDQEIIPLNIKDYPPPFGGPISDLKK